MIGLKQILGGLWHGTKSVNNAALARFLGGTDRDAERADKPFQQVAAVNRCIRIRGDALSMPLMVSTRDDELVESGEIMDFFNEPWPGATSEDLVEWIDALVMLTGACYLVIEEATGSLPLRVRPVGAGNCRPDYSPDGELAGYKYHKPGDRSGRIRTLGVEEVIPFTLADYQSQRLHDGLSQIEPAQRAIDQIFAADTSNLESLHGGVEPGLVFDYGPNTTPTEEQRNEIYRQLDEQHRGPYKRRRPIVIGGGATVSDFVKKFTEMEFAKLKSMSVVDVCVTLGVPPLVAGYAGEERLGHGKEMQEANSIFWFSTVLPASNWIARKLTVHLLPRFQRRSRTFNKTVVPPRHELRCPTYRAAHRHARRQRVAVAAAGIREPLEYFVWFDSSSVDAVREAALRRISEAAVLTEKLGATQAEVIEAFDAPISADHEWQQTWWKPMGLVDVQEEAGLPGDDDLPGPPPTPENPDKAAPTIYAKAEHIERLTEAQLARLWQLWRASWAGIEKTWVSRHGHVVNQLRNQVLSNLFRLMPEDKSFTAVQRKDLIGEVLFNLIEADKLLIARVGPLIRHAVALGGEQAMSEAAAAEGKPAEDATPFNIADPLVQQRIRSREVRVRDTNRTTRRRLAATMAEGFENGESTTQIADRIRKEFKYSSARVKTIARDHIGSAVEDARHEGRRQASVPSKSWLWSRKETGRPWHMEEEQITLATPIGNNEYFVLPQTGGRTLYPRGEGLTAEDTANCGCTTIARYPGDSVKDARMITHLVEHGFLTGEELSRRLTAISQKAALEAA